MSSCFLPSLASCRVLSYVKQTSSLLSHVFIPTTTATDKVITCMDRAVILKCRSPREVSQGLNVEIDLKTDITS